LNDTHQSCGELLPGTHIWGFDEGDGWVKVGQMFVPLALDGEPVLQRPDFRSRRLNGTRQSLLWMAGPWSACAAACGDSIVVRKVACPPCLDVSTCEGSGPKPSDSNDCKDYTACETDVLAGSSLQQWLAVSLIFAGCSFGACLTFAICQARRHLANSFNTRRVAHQTERPSEAPHDKIDDVHLKWQLALEGDGRSVELVRLCPGGHPARASSTAVPWDGDFSCDSCGQEMPTGACMWRCVECSMELCYSCCSTPSRTSQASPLSEEIGRSLQENISSDSQIQIKVPPSHLSTAAEQQPLERTLRRSELWSLEAQNKALRVALQRQQAQLEDQTATLEQMRQRRASTSSELQELAEPFTRILGHEMLPGRNESTEANMSMPHNCEGSSSANREGNMYAAQQISSGAVRTVDLTSAMLAKRWEEVQRAPRSEKPAKLRQIEELKAHPDFVAAQRMLREAPSLHAL